VLDAWMHFSKLCDDHKVASQSVQPRFMTGVLVSSSTLNGQPQKYPQQYPPLDRLKTTWPTVHPKNVLKLVHYNTDTPENLLEEASRVIELMDSTMDGFQFNVCWPAPSVLHTLKRHHPNLYILLQVGAAALRQFEYISEAKSFGYNAPAFASKVREYAGCVDEILLDPSGGLGISLNAPKLVPLVQTLAHFDGLGLSVAGGLSAETVSDIQPLLGLCPYLGIDAQKRLRHPATDELDMWQVEAYMTAAFRLLYPKQPDQRINSMRELDLLVGRYPGGRNDEGMSGGIPRG
jgi:hypothetical protein